MPDKWEEIAERVSDAVCDIADEFRKAYAEGQRDMRKRAVKAASKVHCEDCCRESPYCTNPAYTAIRALEIRGE